ncbi:MAG: hypothetical protein PHH22_01945 [Clostridia bacterium]|nr:hypothetical protein [Clostridia bacterium]
MNDFEIELINQNRKHKDEKKKSIKHDKVLFRIIFAVLGFIAIAVLIVFFYLLFTSNERNETKFNTQLLQVYAKVIDEKQKKNLDPYYEYYGVNAASRQNSREKEYKDISKMLKLEINEDFYVLAKDELAYFDLDIDNLYLVNYDLGLVFCLNPFINEKTGVLKYTMPAILNTYVLNDNFDNSGANLPVIYKGMIPVKYDENSQEWVAVKDPTIQSTWYNYDRKQWANVMLSDTTGEDTLDGSMFVWIPRFAYKISEKNYHVNNFGIIDVKFLLEDTNTTYDGIDVDPNNIDPVEDYVIHPAFKAFGGLEGIWVSKFEASSHEYGDIGASLNVYNTTKPTYYSYFNKYSWTNIDIGTAYTVSKNMVNNNIYGLNNIQVNTHLMKNSEWGAVAYLTQSNYGRNSNNVWNNNYYDSIGTKTGYGARSSSDTKYGAIIDEVTYMYDTSNGSKASTTGNVYGVYDMVGGAIERVAAFLNNGSSSLEEFGSSMYHEKYADMVDVYYPGNEDTQIANYQMTKQIVGDAVYETSATGNSKTSWFGSNSGMMNNEYTYFFRGGTGITQEDIVGLFFYSPSSGGTYALSGFRTVITSNDKSVIEYVK